MRTVWRSWFWNIFSALCASVGVLIGLVMALDPGAGVITRTIYGAGGAFFLWIMVRALLMRVVATPKGIAIRGLFRSRFVKWQDIEEISCRGPDSNIIGSIFPSVYLNGFGESIKDGKGSAKLRVELLILTSYVIGPRTVQLSIACKATNGLNEHLAAWITATR